MFIYYHGLRYSRHVLRIVGNDYNGNMKTSLDFQKFLPQAGSKRGIQGGKWFIEKEQPRASNEGTGKGDALLLATRNLPR